MAATAHRKEDQGPAHTQDSSDAQPKTDAPVTPVREHENTRTDAAQSPARDLQARLHNAVTPKRSNSLRHIAVTVLTVVLATWVAGYLMYATL